MTIIFSLPCMSSTLFDSLRLSSMIYIFQDLFFILE
uniref:Uncharacterized protein n=1 Tax=viral metagenome TaxID=1070528 RepID=A0A6C0D188_9ZZZZ